MMDDLDTSQQWKNSATMSRGTSCLALAFIHKLQFSPLPFQTLMGIKLQFGPF